MQQQTDGRREIASRNTGWAHAVARWLTRRNISPNRISIMSVFFSALGGGLLLSPGLFGYVSLYIIFILYAVCIQLRLLCNLFDGMVAVEGGKKSANGDLYNDIPDRFADLLLIVPAGYVAGGYGIELGWLAGSLAVITAYFRWIGAYKTGNHYFNGPMAKQHRMALLTGTALVGLFFIRSGTYPMVFLVSLIIMNIGLLITLGRRLYLMSHESGKEQ